MHWLPPTDNFTPLLWARDEEKLTEYSVSIQVLMFGSILPISLQQIEYEKNPRSAFKRAHNELHNETHNHIHWQIFGGQYCEIRRFNAPEEWRKKKITNDEWWTWQRELQEILCCNSAANKLFTHEIAETTKLVRPLRTLHVHFTSNLLSTLWTYALGYWYWIQIKWSK